MIQQHPYPNGVPKLLDQFGNEIRRDPKTGRPDGDAIPGGIALPHSLSFIAKFSGAQHSYWHDRWDEAMRSSRADAEAMRRDAYLMALLQERQLAVANLTWHLEVPDEKDRYQLRVRDGLTRIIKGIRNFRRMVGWWLEALWFGRFGVQVEWAWCKFDDRAPEEKKQQDQDPLQELMGGVRQIRQMQQPPQPGMPPPGMGPPGMLPPPMPPPGMMGMNKKKSKPGSHFRRGLTVKQAWPVNGDKIGHQYDHTPYVLIHGAQSDLWKDKAEVIITTLGRAISLRGTWRERFIIHKHLMEDVDYFAADQAEAIHGVGIRSKLFWSNWLKMEWLGNITDFFDRVGLGVTIWTYPMGNPEAKAAVMQAAREQSNRAHIFVPRSPDAGRDTGSGVERMEVPTAGAEALVKLVQYLDGNMERYVVGQEASSGGLAGLGGGAAGAAFQVATKSQIIKQDAAYLGETITGSDMEPGLVNTMLKWTYPDADFPVRFVFEVESQESDRKLMAIQAVVGMGLKVKADDARLAAGLTKPSDGDELVEPPDQKQQMMEQAAMVASGGGANPLASTLAGGEPGGPPPEEGGGGGMPPPDAGGAPPPAAAAEAAKEPGDFLDSHQADVGGVGSAGRRVTAPPAIQQERGWMRALFIISHYRHLHPLLLPSGSSSLALSRRASAMSCRPL